MELESKISFVSHMKVKESDSNWKKVASVTGIQFLLLRDPKFLQSAKASLSSTRKSPSGKLQNVPKKTNH